MGRGGNPPGVCLNRLPQPPEADRILVIRLGAVGDVVRTLPAVSSLRAAYPGAQIAWLVEPASSSAVRGQPWIDEVIVFPRGSLGEALDRRRFGPPLRELWAFLRALRERRFDLVLDFHAILRSAALARLSGARRRISYAPPFGRELAYLFANRRARLSPVRISRFARNAGLVEYLGVEAAPAARPLAVDPDARRRIERELGSGPAPVAIHPGTSDSTPHKRYPAEGYVQVARALAERDGVPSVVTCGPARGDRAMAEAIVGASQGAARPAPATETIAELAALLACCRLYVGSDTGPMHVASLVGTPVVQIIGPTDPVENLPYPGTASRTVSAPVPCRPCRRGCSAATCMRRVPPAAVLAAARDLLAEPAGERAARAGGRGPA